MKRVVVYALARCDGGPLCHIFAALGPDNRPVVMGPVWKTDDEPPHVVGGDVKFPLHPGPIVSVDPSDPLPLVYREHWTCLREFGFAAKHCLCPACLPTARAERVCVDCHRTITEHTSGCFGRFIPPLANPY